MDPLTIEKMAIAFRRAIERANPVTLGITFTHFPHGSCGDAAILLGTYLEANGIDDLKYICGQRGNRFHAWLERDGLVIDITADQFEDCSRPVIVEQDSKWHQNFDRDYEGESNLHGYDRHTEATLASMYSTILKYMR